MRLSMVPRLSPSGFWTAVPCTLSAEMRRPVSSCFNSSLLVAIKASCCDIRLNSPPDATAFLVLLQESSCASRRARLALQTWRISTPTGATYRILQQADRTYGVEVSIPGSHPTLVTGLATKEAANSWIARHQEQIASG